MATIKVLFLQQLFRTNRLRVVDSLILQRRLYCPTTVCDWCFRSVCVRPDARPVSTVVHARADERILYSHSFLVMGSECFVPQFGKVYPRHSHMSIHT